MTLTILRKYYQVTTRSDGFWMGCFSLLIFFVSFMLVGLLLTNNELYFLVSLVSFSMLNDFQKIKLGVNIDLGNFLVFPFSKVTLFLILLAKNFFSEKLILLLCYLLVVNFIHHFHASISFLLVITYTLYCLIFIPVDILSRRKAPFSVVFKLVAQLTILLIIPFMVSGVNPAAIKTDIITEFTAKALMPAHYLAILGVSLFFASLSYYAFRKAYVKVPFNSPYIIKNFNKNYWY